MSIENFGMKPPDPGDIRFLQRAEEIQGALGNEKARPAAEEEIQAAAREFESFMLYYLIKVMRETVQESELLGNRRAEKIYRSMQDEQIAAALAERGGIGLGESLRIQLKRNVPAQGLPESGAVEAGPRLPKFLRMIGAKVTSHFGFRSDPFSGENRWHKGTDLALPEGAPVRAAAQGTVVFSGTMRGYGNVVILRHAGNLDTVYAHNQSNERKIGDQVEQGETVALAGMTGRATGPHVHFEVRKHGVAVNPAKYVEFEVTEDL